MLILTLPPDLPETPERTKIKTLRFISMTEIGLLLLGRGAW